MCNRHGDFDDFFLYGADEALAGTNINYDLNLVLTGVDKEDPTWYFSPVANCTSDQKLDCGLRHAQVLVFQMISDLSSKNIEVEVEYRHSKNPNGEATVVTYSDSLIKTTLAPSLGAVIDVLYGIFQFQQCSFSLADAVRGVGEECLDNHGGGGGEPVSPQEDFPPVRKPRFEVVWFVTFESSFCQERV